MNGKREPYLVLPVIIQITVRLLLFAPAIAKMLVVVCWNIFVLETKYYKVIQYVTLVMNVWMALV